MWKFSATFAFCIKVHGLATFFIALTNCFFQVHLLSPSKIWQLRVLKSYKVFMEPPYTIITFFLSWVLHPTNAKWLAFAFKVMVQCGSAFEPGASGLPYYCTPPVNAPDVIGGRTVWRQNKKTQKTVHLLRWVLEPKERKKERNRGRRFILRVISPQTLGCPCIAHIYMCLAMFYLSVLHSVLLRSLSQHDRPTWIIVHTHLHAHTQTHIRRRTPKDTPKDTLHAHEHTHVRAWHCVANRYALTHTNMHVHTHTVTIC